jgi:hypothetical protein
MVALLVIAAGAVLVASAVATATIPDAAGVIHGCYKKGSGALRVIDDATSACATNETSLNWNVQGQPGVQGPPGQAGVTGLEVVVAESEFDSSTLALATAVCPAGKKVIGGGAVAASQFISTPFALVGSRPDPTEPEAWTAVGKEMSQTDDTHRLVAWAYCAVVS